MRQLGQRQTDVQFWKMQSKVGLKRFKICIIIFIPLKLFYCFQQKHKIKLFSAFSFILRAFKVFLLVEHYNKFFNSILFIYFYTNEIKKRTQYKHFFIAMKIDYMSKKQKNKGNF